MIVPPRARWARLLAGLALAGCSDPVPPAPELAVSAPRVVAGATVNATWSAPGATSVDLTDTEGRALRLGAAATGEVEVAVLQSTELRLIARHESGDVEARRAVEAVPRLVADLIPTTYAAGATRFALRWDSLGAEAHELTVGGAPDPAFSSAARGTYEGRVEGGPGAVQLRLEARAGTLTATFAADLRVFAGEVEPNDTPASAGVVEAGVVGAIAPGEVDVFAVDVPEGGHVQAILRDINGGCGVPGALRLLDAAGRALARAEGTRGCARLDPRDGPGDRDLAAGTYFVAVRGLEAADYLLELAPGAPSCGDQVVESRAGEHCEPGAMPEVCKADCTVDALEEVEPNDSAGAAQPIELGRLVVGRVDAASGPDQDFYKVQLSAPARLRVAVTGPELVGCGFPLGGVALRRADGIQLQARQTDQLGEHCGLLTGHEQGELPAGTYYVVVGLARDEGPPVPRYFLEVDAVGDPVCGDGVREADEACDDGNRASGDGCNATCGLEPAARLTPRLEPWVLSGGPLEADETMRVELEVDAPSVLYLDTFVPDEGRCEGPDADVRVTLDGALLSDDGGIGLCAAADTFADPGLHTLDVTPATGRLGPFSVVVRLFHPDAGCGDLLVDYDGGEACDDGNQESGDGCDADCALEPRAGPPISMSTTVRIETLARRGETVAYPMTIAEEDTLVTFTPTPGRDGFCPEAFHMVVLDDAFGYVGGQRANFDGQCRAGSARAGAAGAHWFVVRNAGRTPVEDLSVQLEYAPPTCGDAVHNPARNEACDDGNLAVGDGCDDACRLEPGRGVEVEPNDTAAQANLLITRTATVGEEAVTVAFHQRGADPTDFFAVVNASGETMWLDAHVETEGECATDVVLRLTDEGGAILAEDDVGGLVRCQELTPSGAPALQALPPGRYALELDARTAWQGTSYLQLRVGSGVAP